MIKVELASWWHHRLVYWTYKCMVGALVVYELDSAVRTRDFDTIVEEGFKVWIRFIFHQVAFTLEIKNTVKKKSKNSFYED